MNIRCGATGFEAEITTNAGEPIPGIESLEISLSVDDRSTALAVINVSSVKVSDAKLYINNIIAPQELLFELRKYFMENP